MSNRWQGGVSLDRLARLVETLTTTGGPAALRTWRPFSLAAFRLVRGLVEDGWSFATVVDVGANAGQFARAAFGAWPDAHVIAFEPLAEVSARLQSAVGRVGRLDVHTMAVGSSDCQTRFYPHEHSLSSSVLRVIAEDKDQFWAKERAPIAVALRRLDSVLADQELRRPLLVKVDVQGFEMEVLEGATVTLAGADAVVLEAAFEPLYVGQAPFPAVHERLTALGWRLVRPLDVRRDDKGRVVEADWLYRRTPAPATTQLRS